MNSKILIDWGVFSEKWDAILNDYPIKKLENYSEAQTRFDIIDRMVKEMLGWTYGQINVEERCIDSSSKYVDYILRAGDTTIVIEAKKIGISFPDPTNKNKLKINSSLIKTGEISKAIDQAVEYSKNKVAQITAVTNGRCWCVFLTKNYLDKEKDSFFHLFFPFDKDQDAKKLFHLISNDTISNSGTSSLINNVEVIDDNRLLTIVPDSETRIDRNNVADYLAPALDGALYSDAY